MAFIAQKGMSACKKIVTYPYLTSRTMLLIYHNENAANICWIHTTKELHPCPNMSGYHHTQQGRHPCYTHITEEGADTPRSE